MEGAAAAARAVIWRSGDQRQVQGFMPWAMRAGCVAVVVVAIDSVEAVDAVGCSTVAS